ncbi:MAG: retroviral-like aspartic protease family protein [Xenococcus sp. (in: cyanobacteria)]
MEVRNTRNDNLHNNQFSAILDTGADYTLIPHNLTESLRLKTNGRKTINIRGDFVQRPTYQLEITFDDKISHSIKAISCEDRLTQGYIILGRNLLNRFDIEFPGRKLVYFIKNP